MIDVLSNLDRRWVFAAMFVAVGWPILSGVRFKEEPSEGVRRVFRAIEDLPEGSTVLMALDYDPSSQGELQPMASAFTRHAAERGHKIYFMTLWPAGSPMIERSLRIVEQEYPDYVYGEDYVNLGYAPGLEGAIKAVVDDLRGQFATDARGNSLDSMPLTEGLRNIQNMDLLVNVSAGDPGAKQWVQYAATPHDIAMVTGTTGVQAPSLYPYIPEQLDGVLGAIKAAAEYEQVLSVAYPKFAESVKAQEGLRRMGPQLVAHLLMIGLIVVGNVIYFVERSRGPGGRR